MFALSLSAGRSSSWRQTAGHVASLRTEYKEPGVVRLPNCREGCIGKHPRSRSLSGSRRLPSCHQLRFPPPLLRFSPACHSLSFSRFLRFPHPPYIVSNDREEETGRGKRVMVVVVVGDGTDTGTHITRARRTHTQVQGHRRVGNTRDNTRGDRQADVDARREERARPHVLRKRRRDAKRQPRKSSRPVQS